MALRAIKSAPSEETAPHHQIADLTNEALILTARNLKDIKPESMERLLSIPSAMQAIVDSGEVPRLQNGLTRAIIKEIRERIAVFEQGAIPLNVGPIQDHLTELKKLGDAADARNAGKEETHTQPDSEPANFKPLQPVRPQLQKTRRRPPAGRLSEAQGVPMFSMPAMNRRINSGLSKETKGRIRENLNFGKLSVDSVLLFESKDGRRYAFEIEGKSENEATMRCVIGENGMENERWILGRENRGDMMYLQTESGRHVFIPVNEVQTISGLRIAESFTPARTTQIIPRSAIETETPVSRETSVTGHETNEEEEIELDVDTDKDIEFAGFTNPAQEANRRTAEESFPRREWGKLNIAQPVQKNRTAIIPTPYNTPSQPLNIPRKELIIDTRSFIKSSQEANNRMAESMFGRLKKANTVRHLQAVPDIEEEEIELTENDLEDITIKDKIIQFRKRAEKVIGGKISGFVNMFRKKAA